MIKTYVIDTNVLIQAPYAIKRLCAKGSEIFEIQGNSK